LSEKQIPQVIGLIERAQNQRELLEAACMRPREVRHQAALRPDSAPTELAPALKTIAELGKAAAGYEAYDLWKTGTQTVFGEGPSPAKIMFVGEQPGDQEDARVIHL
jgi:hypothetical protein